MEKIIKPGHTLNRVLCAILVCMSVIFFACSKPDDPTPVVPLPPVSPPPSSTASGIIDTFYLNDTLLPNGKGTTAKWNVTGTNSLTIVTFNGVKVAFSGVLDTGPLQVTTTFTLAVNSGKQVTRTVHVADTLTTDLWNTSRNLKLTKTEYYVSLSGFSGPQWRDTTLSVSMSSQRMSFGLDGNIYIVQLSPIYTVANGGKYVVTLPSSPSSYGSYDWKGTTYIIGYLDSKTLQVTYILKQPNGTANTTRDTYVYD